MVTAGLNHHLYFSDLSRVDIVEVRLVRNVWRISARFKSGRPAWTSSNVRSPVSQLKSRDWWPSYRPIEPTAKLWELRFTHKGPQKPHLAAKSRNSRGTMTLTAATAETWIPNPDVFILVMCAKSSTTDADFVCFDRFESTLKWTIETNHFDI